jgi:response regulator of citrate/malate metabolism
VTTNQYNLLLIEDDIHIGEKLLNTIKALEIIDKIHLSSNLKEGKQMLVETNYDVIILDLSLPDGNGIELLRWLKEKNIEVKVYIFSMNIELKKMCLKNGATAFFDKSKDFELLIKSITTTN